MLGFFKDKAQYSKTYSQQGEDRVIDFILKSKGIEKPFYLDIGANHPLYLSNTYYFYQQGGSGICIEPNIAFKDMYKKFRPRDILLSIGVTGGKTTELPYYVMDWHEFNSFDEVQAKEVEKHYAGKNNIKQKVTLPVVNINEVLQKHAKQKIDLLNLDVEGFDLDILQSYDFDKYAPGVICVELKDMKTGAQNEKIRDFLLSKGYVLSASNLINGIFSKGD